MALRPLARCAALSLQHGRSLEAASSAPLLAALSGTSEWRQPCSRHFSSSGGTPVGPELLLAAAQPLEPLLQLLHPAVLGSSVWELAHSASGLPWWASIPATTFALRTALLPLTLKARASALNFLLAQRAAQTASTLLEQMQQQQQLEPGPGGGAGPLAAQRGSSSGGMLKRPSWWKLSRMYYRYYRKQHKTTSLGWFVANAAVQVNVFIWMSIALRQMAQSQWPGLTTEGISLISDLTQPSVMLDSLLCPYGAAGTIMPILLIWLYVNTIRQLPLARTSPRLLLLLDLGTLPYALVSFCVPQATLLYWASNSAFFFGLQAALQRQQIAAALGLPLALLPEPRGAKEEKLRAEREAAEASQLVCGSEDDGFLRYLASSYLNRGLHQQALQCLQRLTVLAPGDAEAFRSLGHTATELEQWPVAAAAYERAAELYAVAGESDEQLTNLLLAGTQWLQAAAEARQLRQQPAARGKRAAAAAAAAAPDSSQPAERSSSSSSSSSSSGKSSKADKQYVQASRMQDYLASAIAVLETAVALPQQGLPDAWYKLAMARAAARQHAAALAAAHTYWDAAGAQQAQEPGARSHAAAKLLPVLVRLVRQASSASDAEQLLAAAPFAVEVAECGWDRQSQEQLQELLLAGARAASQSGQTVQSERLKQLAAQLQGLVVRQSKFSGRSASKAAAAAAAATAGGAAAAGAGKQP